MWVKTTCCNSSLSSFKLETSFTMYWCGLLPVRRLQPERATTLSRFPASPGRELQPPLSLALAKILVRRCWPTEGYNLLFLPGTTFHQFSNWIHEHQTIIKNQPISFSPTRSETSRYFSDNCTQNTVPETTQQKQNPKHSSNK